MKSVALFVAVFLISTGPAGAEPKKRPPRGAPYSVPFADMDAALTCINGEDVSQGDASALDGSGVSEPILLVHGTGFTGRINYGWNYLRALPDAGFEVCYVDLPRGALADIQVAAEYVARAVYVMNRETHSKIDMLGHSQGGLLPRWSIKWFASGTLVDDFVALAPPNHGTLVADAVTAGGQSCAACWQMRTFSMFVEALNQGDETPRAASYTVIYSATDELVQPVGTQDIDGASNLMLQDLCPGRPADHITIAADGVAYSLAIDAFTMPGPADPERAGYSCTDAFMPGTTFPGPEEFPDWQMDVWTDEEPPLKPYAT